MKLYPPYVLDDIRSRLRISDIVGRVVTWDRKKSNPAKQEYYACCPFHAENTPSFHVRDRRGSYHCFGCGADGDIFTFVQETDGLSFREAVAQLAGEAGLADGGLAPIPPEEQDRRRKESEAAREKAEQADNIYREAERKKAYGIWRGGEPIRRSAIEPYLIARKVWPLSSSLHIRCAPDLTYWHTRTNVQTGRDEPYELYSGPAILLPITGSTGHFLGVHITFVDPDRPGEKIELVCPRSGEDLPAKKIRGSQRCGAIRLIERERPTRLVIGEGFENVGSVMRAELARGTKYRRNVIAQTDYWTSISLQHLGGKASETISHPYLKNKVGRPLKIPGPGPDFSDERALSIPDTIEEVITLQDGDSDRFTCVNVHKRAARRWATPGRVIKSAYPGDDADFNDIRRFGGPREAVATSADKDGAQPDQPDKRRGVAEPRQGDKQECREAAPNVPVSRPDDDELGAAESRTEGVGAPDEAVAPAARQGQSNKHREAVQNDEAACAD